MAKEPDPSQSGKSCGTERPAGEDRKKRLAEALRRNLAKRKPKKDPASKVD